MKKFAVCALIIGLIAVMAVPSLAWDASKQKSLGQDKNKMTWYVIDYGKDDNGVPFAISRKYYTNTTIKNTTIELLMSKFGIAPDKANGLYFTEYCYEYSPDGKQFAQTYVRHYNMLGEEIYGTVYDDSSDATKKDWIALSAVPGQTPAKAASYALGKPATTTTTTATTTKKTTTKKASATVPQKRVVRAKKGN